MERCFLLNCLATFTFLICKTSIGSFPRISRCVVRSLRCMWFFLSLLRRFHGVVGLTAHGFLRGLFRGTEENVMRPHRKIGRRCSNCSEDVDESEGLNNLYR